MHGQFIFEGQDLRAGLEQTGDSMDVVVMSSSCSRFMVSTSPVLTASAYF
jgi:hypothetical protein